MDVSSITEKVLPALKKAVYVPYIGWMPAMALFPEDESITWHSRQAFVIAAVIAGVQILAYFLIILMPQSMKITKLSLVIAIYLFHGIYLVLAVIGTFFLVRERSLRIPLVGKVAERIDI